MPIPLSSQPIRRLVRRHATGFCKRLPSIAVSTVLAVCTGAGIPATASGGGPERVKVAFYNTENLFDTIRNPLISDGEYTPQGARHWDTQRYACKIGRIARVLDELNADIVGLAEVENEAVVRDLMFAMRQDYNYIHRNTDDPRGIDVALLYRGSAFVPQRVNQVGGNAVRRQFLMVDGDLYGERVCVVVFHMPSMLNDAALRNRAADALHAAADSLARLNPERKVIVMGDFNATPRSQAGRTVTGERFFTPFTESERRGYGSYVYRDRRLLYDFIMMSHNLREVPKAGTGTDTELHFGGTYGIFVREYQLNMSGSKRGYPLRTFDGNTYTAGYSDHLPVWIVLERKNTIPVNDEKQE